MECVQEDTTLSMSQAHTHSMHFNRIECNYVEMTK